MWENITIAGRIILFALAGYGAYNLYLLYQAKREEEKESK